MTPRRPRSSVRHLKIHSPPMVNWMMLSIIAVPERYRGTAQDKRDMLVHGKKQELRRNFKLLTMTGFVSMVVCAWEGLLPLFNYALLDGGTALMFWGFIAVAISMSLVYLSISELASM